MTGSEHAEPLHEGVAFVEEDRVVAGDPSLPGNRWHHGVEIADRRLPFDAAAEQAADDRFVDELVADGKLAARRLLRDPRGSAGAAGRAVDRLLAIEDGIAGMRLRMMRFSRPKDVTEPGDGRILGMDEGIFLVDQPANDRRQALDVESRDVVEVAIMLLRFDDRIEIAAIGNVEDEPAEVGDVDVEPRLVKEGGNVADAHLDDVAVVVAAILGFDDARG